MTDILIPCRIARRLTAKHCCQTVMVKPDLTTVFKAAHGAMTGFNRYRVGSDAIAPAILWGNCVQTEGSSQPVGRGGSGPPCGPDAWSNAWSNAASITWHATEQSRVRTPNLCAICHHFKSIVNSQWCSLQLHLSSTASRRTAWPGRQLSESCSHDTHQSPLICVVT